MADRLLVGAHVITPVVALLRISGRELPVLASQVQAPEKTALLLLAREVQEEFPNRNAVPRGISFKRHNVLEPLVPDPLCDERCRQLLVVERLWMHAHHERFLVVGAIEDSDPPAFGETAARPPQKIVIEFLG